MKTVRLKNCSCIEITGIESVDVLYKIGGYDGCIDGQDAIILPSELPPIDEEDISEGEIRDNLAKEPLIRIPSFDEIGNKDEMERCKAEIEKNVFFVLTNDINHIYFSGDAALLNCSFTAYNVEILVDRIQRPWFFKIYLSKDMLKKGQATYWSTMDHWYARSNSLEAFYRTISNDPIDISKLQQMFFLEFFDKDPAVKDAESIYVMYCDRATREEMNAEIINPPHILISDCIDDYENMDEHLI